MAHVRREIDNDLRSPTYLCEVEEVVAARPSRAPGWILPVLLLTLVAVGRIEDVAAVAHGLDRLVDWVAGYTSR